MEISVNKASQWYVPMMIGAVVGAIVSFALTTLLVLNDPSSTAAIAYIFTLPFGVGIGLLLGAIYRWRFPKS